MLGEIGQTENPSTPFLFLGKKIVHSEGGDEWQGPSLKAISFTTWTFPHYKSIINTYVTMSHDRQGDAWCMTDTAVCTMHSLTHSSHCLFTTFLTYICLMGAILHCLYENQMNITIAPNVVFKMPEVTSRRQTWNSTKSSFEEPQKSWIYYFERKKQRITGKILKKICF